MSIFNFRRGRPSKANAASKASPPAAPESVEAVRKRARQRLIGSAVLVLLAVVGFPLLFESQPRPVPVDIPIEIPSRQAVKPAAPVEPVLRGEQAVQGAGAVASDAGTAPAAPAASSPATGQAAPQTAEAKPEPAANKPDAKPQARPDDGQRAKALLDGAAPAAADAGSDNRLVVQVGAYSDADKVREVRAKLEKAGFKTYTQVAETKDGKRTRVRIGPFATKAEADKAAARVKALDLPAAVISL